MRFEVKKKENCFADAENYSYVLEVEGAAIMSLLEASGEACELRTNNELRRPTFLAKLTYGPRVKGLLERNAIRVGYDPEQAEAQKARFERWLEGLEAP